MLSPNVAVVREHLSVCGWQRFVPATVNRDSSSILLISAVPKTLLKVHNSGEILEKLGK